MWVVRFFVLSTLAYASGRACKALSMRRSVSSLPRKAASSYMSGPFPAATRQTRQAFQGLWPPASAQASMAVRWLSMLKSSSPSRRRLELAHFGGGTVLPVLAGELVVHAVFRRGDEEEVAERPELFDERNLLHFHHAHHLFHAFDGRFDAVFAENLVKLRSEHTVVCFENVFAVEPLSLDIVELRSALRTLREVKLLDELLHRKDFLVCSWVPSEQSEEIDDSFRQIAAFAVARADGAVGAVPFQREYGEAKAVAIAFGEFAFAVGFEQKRQVGEARHGVFPSEGAVEEHVEWGTWQPFLTANHVCDFHEMVVNDVGQVVSGELVSTLVKHLVIEHVRHDAHVATDDVVNVNLFARLDFEAHHILLASFDEALRLLFAEGDRVAHHAARVGIILEILDFLALLRQFLWRVEGDVGLSSIEQQFDILLIDVAAFALSVGAVFSAEADTFVKLYAEPSERLEDIVFRAGNEAVGVGVFDAEHEVAAVLACKEIVIEGCADTSDVQRSGGGWVRSALSLFFQTCFSFFMDFIVDGACRLGA